ncbi:putative transcription factor GeBP family [Helianthus anomalus]
MVVKRSSFFHRLWSEDNEIDLIQGMISYVDEKGKDPVTDVKGDVITKTNTSCKPVGVGNGDVGIEVIPDEVEVKTVRPCDLLVCLAIY